MHLTDLCEAIREQQKLYIDIERAEGDMNRRVLSICRRIICARSYQCGAHMKGARHSAECVRDTKALFKRVQTEESCIGVDAEAFATCSSLIGLVPIMVARKRELEKRRDAMIEDLPIWPWVKSVRGMSHGSVGRIVGGAGDLFSFPSYVPLWKRFGVGMVTGSDGRRVPQRRVQGDEAILHGYAPQRRSDVFNVVEPLLRQNERYRALYAERREQTGCSRDESGKWAKSGAGTHPEWTLGHSHNDAHRIVAQWVLRDFWEAWWEAGTELSSRNGAA